MSGPGFASAGAVAGGVPWFIGDGKRTGNPIIPYNTQYIPIYHEEIIQKYLKTC